MAHKLYSLAGRLELPKPDIWLSLNVYNLREIVQAFVANANRIHSFWKLAPHLMEEASSHVLGICRATFAITGRPELTHDEMFDRELHEKIREKLAEDIVERFQQTKDVDEAKGYDFDRGIFNLEWMVDEDEQLKSAIFATFCSQLTAAWTAWEALATDLWEAALNYHPAKLATLSGTRSRISKKVGLSENEEGAESAQREFDPRLSDFQRTTGGTFNAEKLMGTLLKKEMKFQTLAGVRRAYSAAFGDKNAAIDAALSVTALDKLNIVRNVILHRAGIVDQKSAEKIVTVPDWNLAFEIGKPIQLDGKKVQELINPVFRLGVDLIRAVDEWIAPKT